MPIKISPSILSADFMNLQSEVELVSGGGADMIHFDVMDGHFVPNLTIGVPFVSAMKSITSLPLDVHLMVDNPATQIAWYLDAGADILSFHIEACSTIDEASQIAYQIRSHGTACGISLNPETPASAIEQLIDKVDMVLVMSVHPGFGGQSFIEDSLGKITEISQMVKASGRDVLIEVDGGINPTTARAVAMAGATSLVAGNAIFGADDRLAALQAIRSAAEEAAEADGVAEADGGTTANKGGEPATADEAVNQETPR